MPAMLRAAEVGRAMHGRISGALRRTSKDDLHILQPVELDRVTDGSDPLSKSAERPDSPQGRRISTMHNSDPEVVLAAVAAVVATYTRKPSAADEAALVRAVPTLARRPAPPCARLQRRRELLLHGRQSLEHGPQIDF